MFKMRASSLGKVMADPRTKSDVLSVGAKTYIVQQAKEFVYGFHKEISGKPLEKGNRVEDASIELYNSVMFTNYKKNTERKSNDWLSGECDIDTGDKIIDIKSSWSLDTFPCLSEDGINKDYEWQGRAYMMLWNRDHFENAYCMVNTPDELIGYEQESIHFVDDITESLRVTITAYERDKLLEEKICERIKECQKYFDLVVDRISTEHNF